MKKAICIVLAFLAVLLCFAACSAETQQGGPGTGSSAVPGPDGPESSPAGSTADPKSVPDLGPLDYGGEVINVMSVDRDWYEDEVYAEAPNGEVINDAVFTRNSKVEERLGVKLNNRVVKYGGSNSAAVNAIEKDYNGGLNEYDIAFVNAYKACETTVNGWYRNLRGIDTIDLEKNYWFAGLNDAVSFKGAQYVASGAISLSSMRLAFATVFNKRLFDEKNIPYVYDTVRSNEWTLEFELKLIKDLYTDKGNPDESVYGWLSSELIMSDAYWEALEIPILGRDADGGYEYAIPADRMVEGVDLLLAMFASEGTRVYPHETADGEFMTISKDFAEGKGAIMTPILIECEREWMRNMTDKYGIAPVPKLNVEQVDYHTHLFDQYTVVTVLAGVPEDRTDMMGAVLEIMAYESSLNTVPAYFEITMKSKYQSDPDSWDMLDMVMDKVQVDAGNVYFSLVSKPHAVLGQIVASKKNTVPNYVTSLKRNVGNSARKLNDSLDALAGNR